MNTLRVLASPKVWGPILGIVAELGGQAFYHGPDRERIQRHRRRGLGRYERVTLLVRGADERQVAAGRSEAAGLEEALWMTGAYLVSAAALGYLISLFGDLSSKRKMSHAEEPVPSGR